VVLWPAEGAAIVEPEPASPPVPAWKAVHDRQLQQADWYWLIAQPDHAMLAGELARAFNSPDCPSLDDEVVTAIALHDAGWRSFDGGEGHGCTQNANAREMASAPLRNAAGRPLSFFEIRPVDFLRAWEDSINEAEEAVGALGGLLVSNHFCRLGTHRLEGTEDTAENVALVRGFLATESRKNTFRLTRQSRSEPQVERLVDVLQFCDLLSLYLCCGAKISVVFPQPIAPEPIVAKRVGELCVLQPSPFTRGLSLSVAARRDPPLQSGPNFSTLTILLQ